MVYFIKAYSEAKYTILEVGVSALNPYSAKIRASLWMFGRTPANLMGLEEIQVFELEDEGPIDTYRVTMKFDSSQGILNRIKRANLRDKVSNSL